jgi:HEAT repeat protein
MKVAVKNSRLLAALVLAGLFGTVAAIYLTRPREPVYDGKPVSYWIRGLASIHVTHNAASNKAFQHIGTNALPVLIKMLRTKDSKAKMWLRNLYYKQSLVQHHFTLAEEDRIPAVLGFSELGSLAKPAVPALIELLADEEISVDAARALAAIGSEAVEPLISALTNRNQKIRLGAIAALGGMRSDARQAVPALARCLGDEQSTIRLAAAEALKKINPEPLVIKGVTH